ncbi:MAG: hypothetical protein FWC75_06355 [Oscillospiraceae bacterium]|nr:hypothetical protein [Oscillospiraceae bacterium]
MKFKDKIQNELAEITAKITEADVEIAEGTKKRDTLLAEKSEFEKMDSIEAVKTASKKLPGINEELAEVESELAHLSVYKNSLKLGYEQLSAIVEPALLEFVSEATEANEYRFREIADLCTALHEKVCEIRELNKAIREDVVTTIREFEPFCKNVGFDTAVSNYLSGVAFNNQIKHVVKCRDDHDPRIARALQYFSY